MDEYNKFLEIFEEEKVQIWENSYINYENIYKEIVNLFQIQKETINANNKEQNNTNMFKKANTEKINNKIEFEKIDCKSISEESVVNKEKIKSFFLLLDKEVKKLNTFYSSKEKDIYQNINKKIQNKSNIKEKPCEEILKEIDNLNYLNELCLQVLCFIHLNIQALKSILRILDKSLNNKDQSISYNYIKKFLSKNNSDLIYILSFKTLDETILSIQGILDEYKQVLENNSIYKNNIEFKNEFKEFKKNIKSNWSKFDEVHEKIFNELKEWKKYLDINLDLPSSSKNSIFRETSFVGDYIEKHKAKGILKENKQIIDRNDKNNLLLSYNKSLIKEPLINLKSEICNIMDEEGNITNPTRKLLTKENFGNIRLFYLLVFFYSYSYFVIIPKILYILVQKLDNKVKYRAYYGIIISFPSLGSLISQQYIMNLINKCNFKVVLIISLFFVVLHYILFILGIFIKEIYLLIFARLLLGLSSIDRLCKIYIDICVPETKQAKATQNYLTSIYFGYIVGLIASDIDIILISLIKYNDKIEYFYSLSGFIIFSIFINITINFNNPSNKDFKIINDSIAEYNKANRLLTKFIDKDEKKIVEKQENLFENANKLAPSFEDNQLKNYSIQIERKKIFHFKKVFLLLFLFLLTSQYINEINLMLLPRIFQLERDKNYDIKNEIHYYSYSSYILFSFSYLISLFSQKYFLKKIFFKKSSQKALIVFFSILFLILFSFFLLTILIITKIIKKELGHWSLLLFVGIFIMIIISELLLVVIINLFIGLIPIEKYKFCCLMASTFINITEKISRLLPGVIYVINRLYFGFSDSKEYYSLLILLGTELFLILLSFLFCFKGKYFLKSHSLTRIINIK